MSYYVFVDNSNVWIEGKYVSGINKGLASSLEEAHEKRIQDNSWTIDFGKLLYSVTDTKIADIAEAILIGSKPTDKDSLWKAMEKAGFSVVNKSRNIANKEKQIDTGIVSVICRYLYKNAKAGDTFVLVMGDSDYVPVLKDIKTEGIKCVVAFWEHASSELKTGCDKFISLNNLLDKITYSSK